MRKGTIQVTLLVAALGLIVAPFALGSNMGFKLERSLNAVSGSQSFYLMSFPFYRSFQDLWNTTNGVLDPGAGGDDGVFSDDVLADWYTNGDGVCGPDAWECVGNITLMYFDNNPASGTFNQFVFQTIAPDPFSGEPAITGVPFEVVDSATPQLQPRGFVAQIAAGGQFPIIIVGSENPDVTQWDVQNVVGSQSFYPFSLPYHSTWTTSEDVLNNGWANKTDNTLILTVMDFDNNCPGSPTCNQFVFQTIAEDPFNPGNPAITGNPYNLVPGNGYMFQVAGGRTNLTLPHY